MISKRVSNYVMSTIESVVDGPDMVAMIEAWKLHGATAVWLVNGSKVTKYTRTAMAQAIGLFRDPRMKTIVAMLSFPIVVMGAKTVSMTLALAGAADLRVLSTFTEGEVLARALSEATS